MDMNIVCLDLEGVLVPEIWIAFAEASGIPELKRTTRDEPDYDKLMENWDTEGAWSGTEGNSGYDREDRPDPGREGILRRAALYYPGHHYQRYLFTVCRSSDEKIRLSDHFL